MGGIQGFPPFVHITHSQDSATTNHLTTSSDHDFFTFLSFFGDMYHGETSGSVPRMAALELDDDDDDLASGVGSP